MFDKIMVFIGKLLSRVFTVVHDTYTGNVVRTNMDREHMHTAIVNTKANFSVSVSSASHVNYFYDTAISEFLKVVAKAIPYAKKDKGYEAYLVTKNSRSVTEYIRFYKETSDAKDAKISYAHINKLISTKPITVYCGKSSDAVLKLDEAIIQTVYYALNPKTPPLYLVHDLGDEVDVGNPEFVYKCYEITKRLIARQVEKWYSSDTEKQFVLNLLNKGGLHFVMSYFASLRSHYYKSMYERCSCEDITSYIRAYNDGYNHKNKIASFVYSRETGSTSPTLEVAADNKHTVLEVRGIRIVFTGNIGNESKNTFYTNFIREFVAGVFDSDDESLIHNFLTYIYSIGGQFANTMSPEEANIDGLDEMRDKAEPAVEKVMEADGFKEDANGSLKSEIFEDRIENVIADLRAADVVQISTPDNSPAVAEPEADSFSKTETADIPDAGGIFETLRTAAEKAPESEKVDAIKPDEPTEKTSASMDALFAQAEKEKQ